MHSIKTKFTVLAITVMIITVVIISCLSVMFIIGSEHRRSEQTLLLLCETGERNLDYYFKGVENSINKVAEFAGNDLETVQPEEFGEHVKRVGDYFDLVAHRTSGVLTYYYRIDPQFSDTEKGFWYTNLEGDEFTEHEVTDISGYDTSDTSQLVWFTVPKATGKPVWLPPYITDNLDVRVISYNIPVYQNGRFVGVVGIEIDYSTMAEQVESIKLFQNGYAFITDENGNLVFHPYIDVAMLTDENRPEVPEGIMDEGTFVEYEYDGIRKEAAWLELDNGMRLYVCVPKSEIDGEWQSLVYEMIIAALILLLIMITVTMRFTGYITKPLQDLTAAAEKVDRGDYDFDLDYDEDDEIGRLSGTFKKLSSHMREHISDLNKKVYVDALTSVRNKGAFSSYLDELQKRLDDPFDRPEFAVGVFDCDDLKTVNDRYGHDKGDIYLKTASRLICKVFQHSPVFRIGGDEFAVVMQNDDYRNRDDLVRQFEEDRKKISEATDQLWEQVHITMGVSVYEPETDNAVIDTVRRADKAMYEHKRAKKAAKEDQND